MKCVKGDREHDFPIENSLGARCPEHGVTLLFRGDPIVAEELTTDYPERPARQSLEPAADGDQPRPELP